MYASGRWIHRGVVVPQSPWPALWEQLLTAAAAEPLEGKEPSEVLEEPPSTSRRSHGRWQPEPRDTCSRRSLVT